MEINTFELNCAGSVIFNKKSHIFVTFACPRATIEYFVNTQCVKSVICGGV